MENKRIRKTGSALQQLIAPIQNDADAPITDTKSRLSVCKPEHRIRKTGSASQPLITPTLKEANPIREAKNRLSVRQRKKRRQLHNEDEQSKIIYQRSRSLSSLFEKVLSRTPQIPEIYVTPPPEPNTLVNSFNDFGDNGLMFLHPGEEEHAKDLEREPHPAECMSQANEAEVNDSPKVLRWQKSPASEMITDNESERSSPTLIAGSQDNHFSFCNDEEEMKELYNQMLRDIREDDCKHLRSLLRKQIVDVNILLEDAGSLLHEAAYQGCVTCIKTLLKFGSYVNLSDELGFTPLHAAVMGRNYDAICLLIENNALPNQVNIDGLSPCHMGVLADDIYVIHELMTGKGDPLLVNESYPVSPFQMAIDMNKENALAYFLNMTLLLVEND